jgi:TRAP-type C4-dicarboxylate transport system permease small subunit
MKAVKIKLAWSYMSLFVGYCLMFLVNLELVIRVFITILGGSAHLKPLQTEQQAGFD